MAAFPGNPFTREFGLDVPIVQGPMGGAANHELVAAVSNAGGLGVLPLWTLSRDDIPGEVRETLRRTSRPFAANFRADLIQVEEIRIAVESGVSIIHLFWGDPSSSIRPVREAGARLICTVWDADSARAALDAGADALIAQGIEAGGHVLSELPLRELLYTVIPMAGGVPVIAAGGLATAQDVADMVRLGASGALLGTRFVATRESIAHDAYKQALIEAGSDATVRSECFDIGWPNAPHRHLENDTYSAWNDAGRPEAGSRPGEGDAILSIGEDVFPRFSVVPPARGMTGDIGAAVLYAGTGVDRIRDCPEAADVVAELASLL